MLAVAALADALYSIWGTNKRLDMSILSRKAVQSLNDYWQGVGSPLKIDIEQYPIEIDDLLRTPSVQRFGSFAASALNGDGIRAVVTREAATHPSWKEKIRAATDTSTRTTKSFTGRSARGIINEFMRRMEEHENDVPLYPIQNALTADIRLAARNAGRPEYLSLWAGQAAGMSKARQPDIPIANLMKQLLDETAQALTR